MENKKRNRNRIGVRRGGIVKKNMINFTMSQSGCLMYIYIAAVCAVTVLDPLHQAVKRLQFIPPFRETGGSSGKLAVLCECHIMLCESLQLY